mgnify:CR=1 FL=1
MAADSKERALDGTEIVVEPDAENQAIPHEVGIPQISIMNVFIMLANLIFKTAKGRN